MVILTAWLPGTRPSAGTGDETPSTGSPAATPGTSSTASWNQAAVEEVPLDARAVGGEAYVVARTGGTVLVTEAGR